MTAKASPAEGKASNTSPGTIAAKFHPRKRSRLSASGFVQGILRGDRNVLAKAITLVESSHPDDRNVAEQIIESCLPASGNSVRVGITGVPGAGKSTLIEALGKFLVTARGERVAVLAVDPTSRRSGGSILGDKTRMRFLASSEKAFIRPSPSRGAQGGVAQHTREAILLCEAAGFPNIFVETVGVGQAEVAVRDMVDFYLLVTLPGAGDELQGIKRGVMEMADLVVVNKADGDNIRDAERARTDAEIALHLLPGSPSGWTPRTMCCSAKTGRGVADLWAHVLDHQALTSSNGWRERMRREQTRRWMHESLEQALMQLFHFDPAIRQNLAAIENQVVAGQVTVPHAVRELLRIYTAGRM